MFGAIALCKRFHEICYVEIYICEVIKEIEYVIATSPERN